MKFRLYLLIVVFLFMLGVVSAASIETYQQTSTMPHGLNFAFDSKNNIYLMTSGGIVKKFDANGNFIKEWYPFNSGNPQLKDGPWGIAADGQDNVYVSDVYNHRIQKFNSEGSFIKEWGSAGNGDGQFIGQLDPYGLATDNFGNVYAVDRTGHQIQKFDSNGKFITKWGSYGTADGQFYSLYMIATDKKDNIYVSDGDNRIKKFDSNGKFITKWGSYGTADGQFNFPSGICTDDQDNVYVVDNKNWRIQKFTSNGIFITKWSIPEGPYNILMGCGVSQTGLVYQSDEVGQTTRIYSPSNGGIISAVQSVTTSSAGKYTVRAEGQTSSPLQQDPQTTTPQNNADNFLSKYFIIIIIFLGCVSVTFVVVIVKKKDSRKIPQKVVAIPDPPLSVPSPQQIPVQSTQPTPQQPFQPSSHVPKKSASQLTNTMDDLPRRKLKEIIAKYGSGIVNEPLKIKGLLLDYCATSKPHSGNNFQKEIHILTLALSQNIPQELLTTSRNEPFAFKRNRLQKRLTDLATDEEAAKWAVESWAEALGVT